MAHPRLSGISPLPGFSQHRFRQLVGERTCEPDRQVVVGVVWEVRGGRGLVGRNQFPLPVEAGVDGRCLNRERTFEATANEVRAG